MKELLKLVDILIVVVGWFKMIIVDYIKEGVVVIDVGVNCLEIGKFCGDVDFDNVLDVVGYIIFVLKGVGLMIIIMFFYNIVEFVKCVGVVCK